MSCVIAVYTESGTIRAVYCEDQSDPSDLGLSLIRNWNSWSMADELVLHGDVLYLDIDGSVDFGSSNVFEFDNETDMLDALQHLTETFFLFMEDIDSGTEATWFVLTGGSDEFVPVLAHIMAPNSECQFVTGTS